jgi:hypothetical protein
MLSRAIADLRPRTVDLLHTDHVRCQRTITGFGVLPGDADWLAAVARHRYVDGLAPR